MVEIIDLPTAINHLVKNGSTVAIEGFSHLVPYAAAQEIIRQNRQDLTVIRMVPDLLVDQMIGAGSVKSLAFSWAGNPGLGLLPRFRDAVENQWPRAIELMEHTHSQLANRYVGGARKLPFMVMRKEPSTDLDAQSQLSRSLTCPFTGEEINCIASLNPDVAIIHAQYSDKNGNVQFAGVGGVNKEAVLASKSALVTVEKIVETLPPTPDRTVLPHWAIDYVAEVEGGAMPSYAEGFYLRDVYAQSNWSAVAGNRESFQTWIDELENGT